jgi:two-component system response regulator WspF
MRIAIVNDLSLARAVLRRVVESVPGYRVAWEAVDGADAVTKAAADRPDAILMDLMMPAVDGAEATRRIMARTPCPILIVTASVGANHGKVYEALGAGGLDAVKTPTFGPCGVVGAEPLLARLAKLGKSSEYRPPVSSPPSAASGLPRVQVPGRPLVAVGASTGGPDAVARVLAGVGLGFPAPIVVVQHIGADYTAGLAEWLARKTGVPVKVPKTGDSPVPGTVYVGGGDDHLVLDPNGRFRYTADPVAYPYRPSVDVFFESAAQHWPGGGVGVLLTGMGADGARGLGLLKARGWLTVGQDKESCVVYGMPKAAAESGAVGEVLPLDQIGPRVRRALAPGR